MTIDVGYLSSFDIANKLLILNSQYEYMNPIEKIIIDDLNYQCQRTKELEMENKKLMSDIEDCMSDICILESKLNEKGE